MGNWDFSGDEVIFFIAAGFTAVVGAFRWYARLVTVRPLGTPAANRVALAIAPPALLVGLGVVLQNWADPKYVVGQLDYILMFLAGGAAWLWVTEALTGALGISTRDDALERGNRAATLAVCGAMTAAMCVYAWCNVGAGPTIWTTILPAVVAGIAWLVMWIIVEQVTHISDAITIDRDVASAWRLTGMLVASAIVLGRAMAGDWTSWSSTFGAFATLGWPALALPVAFIPLHQMLRPTPQSPIPSAMTAGFIPAAAMVGAAILYVAMLGPPDIGKHVITYEEHIGGQ